MITDMQRREVAARLRICAQNVSGTLVFAMHLSNWVGIKGVTDDEGNYFSVAADRRCAKRTLEKLADLIDRPTCHDVADFDRESFKCSRCGFRVLSIDGAPDAAKLVGTKGGVIDFGYCPDCGAEVKDDAEPNLKEN